MFNRTLQRPMFRIGGSAGTGITSGLSKPRQGYNTAGSVNDYEWDELDPEKNKQRLIELGIWPNLEEGGATVQDNKLVPAGTENTGNNNTTGSIGDTNKMSEVDSSLAMLKALDKSNPYPESKPYPYKGSDFFMGLGANILAQPGGQPIFQVLGKSAIPALDELGKTQRGDWALKQQDKLGKWKANRELLLTAWKNLDKEKKTSMMRDAEYYVKEGVFPDVGTALEAMLFRKDKRPDVYKRDWIDNRAIELRKKDFEGEALGAQGAQQVASLEWDILRGNIDSKIKSKLDPEQKYVDPVRRTYSPDGKSFTLNDATELDTYDVGYVYFNLDDKQWYIFNGTNFTLYDDETEEIKVD